MRASAAFLLTILLVIVALTVTSVSQASFDRKGQKPRSLNEHFALKARIPALSALFPESTSRKSAVQTTCVLPPSGMVSWWPGDGNANDIQGGNNGTLRNGATFASGSVEQAFSFDGVDDYLDVAANPNLHPGAITIDMWLKATSWNNQSPAIIGSNLNDQDGYQLQLQADGRVIFDIGGNTTRTIYQSAPSEIVVGQWYHVAVTYDGVGGTGSLKLYLNGVQRPFGLHASSEPAGPIYYSTIYPLSIGRRPANQDNYFNGLIDEVDIFNRPLTASEIQVIYSAGSAGKCKPLCTPPPSNMVGWWPGDGNANDIQGENGGVLQSGTTFAAGLVGQAFSLDGADDLVLVSDNPSLNFGDNQDFAIDAWINLQNPVAGATDDIVSKVKHAPDGFSNGYLLSVTPDSQRLFLNLSINNGNTSVSVTSSAAIPLNQWTHVAAVRQGSMGLLYINGVLDGSGQLSTVSMANSWPLSIGGIYDTRFSPPVQRNNAFGGVIDEVEIFNRALSASEIQAIYNAGSAGKCKPTEGVTSLSLDPATVVGGQPSTATIILRRAALVGGALVTLSSSDVTVATVPENVTIPEGATSGTFTVNTNVVTSDSAVTISASYLGETRTASLNVTALLPDLQVTSINAPAQTSTDSAFDLTWTDVNNGQAHANGPWSDKVYLSTDDQLGNDIQLAEFPFSQSLDPGLSASRTQVISVPRTAVPSDGQYFLIVLIDANNNVNEGGNENNNTRALAITVHRTPLPDLVVQAIQAPNTTFFDETIQVRWTVRNTGSGPTDASSWFDAVYLSSDQTIGDDALQVNTVNASYLNAGEGYIGTAELRVPRGIFGTYYLIVKSDNGNAVAEDNEDNNTLNRAIDLQVPPLPDLQVSLVQAPDQGFPGEPMLLNWTIVNQGTRGTPPGEESWNDGIYLSQTPTFNPATARFIGSRQHDGGLAQNLSYSVSGFSVALPRDIIGDWFVFVVADYQNKVYEFVFENNNGNYDVRRPIHINATPPDLIVASISAANTGTAARQINVQWNVQNQGAFDAAPGWFDTVYFSSDSTLDPATDQPLVTIFRNGVLGGGQNYAASANLTLPACISGTYYLFVFTDSRKQIFEFDPNFNAEENNFGQPQPIQITPLPPDLQVTAVSNPANGGAGQTVPITWTVTNSGTGPTIEGTWVDRVYFSLTPTLDTTTALVAADYSHTGDIGSNGSYTRTENVQIPQTAQGTYYVFVSTDGGVHTAVQECANENNNVGVGAVTIDISNTQPDLTVASVSGPASAFAGQHVTAQWAVSNAGSAATQTPAWNDKVYFSTDTVLDDNDTEIGTALFRGSLPLGGSYQGQAQGTIPFVAAEGIYYLIVAADSGNFVFEGQHENNNTGSTAIQINIPSVDLQMTAVDVPVQNFSGQPMPVSWTVQNTGTMQSFVASWTDYVFLSRDQILDSTDRSIAYKVHQGSLVGGASYNASVDAIVPPGLSGQYYVFVRADFHNRVVETDENNNLGGPNGVTLLLPPPVDLTVATVEAPASGSPGEPSTFQWTGQNIGTNTAIGGWTDAVYLSADTTWDIGDPLVGRVDHNGPPTPGQPYTGTLTATVPAIDPGHYYVIVRADVRNNVREFDETNNTTASSATTTLDVTELQLGVPFSSTLQTGQEQYHKVNVPADETLLYTLHAEHQDSSTELFSRFSLMPNRSVFDFSFSRPNEANQQVVVPDTQGGFYYDLARGVNVPPDPSSVTQITLKAELVPFSIRSVTPSSGGNVGEVTLEISGARFGPDTNVSLVAQNQEINPVWFERVDPSLIHVTFDLHGVTPEVYDLRAQSVSDILDINPDTGETYVRRVVNHNYVLPNGFEVTRGGGPALRTNLSFPSSARIRNLFSFVLEVGNEGNTDLPIPILLVGSPNGTPLSLSPDVNENTASQEQIIVLGQRRRKILAPGERVFVQIYARATRAPSSQFILRNLAAPGASVNWDSLESYYRNENSEESSETWLAFKQLVGNTWDSLHEAMMTTAAERSSQTRDRVYSGRQLMQYLLEQARSGLVSSRGVGSQGRGSKFNGVELQEAFDPREVYRILRILDALSDPCNNELSDAELILLEAWVRVANSTTMVTLFGSEVSNIYSRFLDNGPPSTLIIPETSEIVQGRYVSGQLRNAGFRNSETTREDVKRLLDLAATKLKEDFCPDQFPANQDYSVPVERLLPSNLNSSIDWNQLPELPAVVVGHALRRLTGKVIVRRVVDSSCNQDRGFVLRTDFKFIVDDTVDFCPPVDFGAPLEQFLTRPFAALEGRNYAADVGVHIVFSPDPQADVVDVSGFSSSCQSNSANQLQSNVSSSNSSECEDPSCSDQPPAPPCSASCGNNPSNSTNCPEGSDGNSGSGNGSGEVATRVPVDPNDKVGPAGFGPQAFVAEDQPMPYTINFENVTIATAAAQRIRITDELEPDIDWRTFRLREIGFGNYRITVPENRAFYQTRIQLGEDLSNLLADIRASIDIATGRVTWTLTAIDPQTGEQPTSALLGLLPPNDDTGRGQGFVTYTALPKATSSTGAQIINNATIIFDTEEPIVTNTVTNTLDADAPASSVTGLPPTSPQAFTVSWSGADPADGSGLQGFDVWVADNDGPYEPLVSGTTDTSAQFTGLPGHTYRFYSIARDNAGNVEAAPSAPDATTTVSGGGVLAAGATLVNESCPPLNTAIDPGERVTVTLNLINNGASISNLVATLQSGGGIVAPTDPKNYGAMATGATVGRDFSFTATGTCGGIVTATLQLQDGNTNLGTVAYTFPLGVNTANGFVCTTPCGGVRLVTTSTLTRISPSTAQALITVQNIGSDSANNATLTTAKLGAINGTPLAQFLGNIAPGSGASAVVNFINSTPGAASVLSVGGTYTGGTFTGSKRVTVP